MSQLVRLEGKHSTQNAHCAVVRCTIAWKWKGRKERETKIGELRQITVIGLDANQTPSSTHYNSTDFFFLSENELSRRQGHNNSPFLSPKGWRVGVFFLFMNHLDLTYHTTSMFLFVDVWRIICKLKGWLRGVFFSLNHLQAQYLTLI